MNFKILNENRTIKILWSRSIIWSFLFMIIFQIITASSNIWLSNLSTAGLNSAANSIFYYFGLFAGSLFLANIPETLSISHLNKAKLNAVQNFTQEFSKSYKNVPTLTLERKIRAEKEPWLTGESEKTIDESLSVLYSSASISLNTLLNIGTLAVIIDPKLILGYLISLGTIPLILKIFKLPLETLSLRAQKNRKSFNQILLSSWENITIGNNYNFNLWWTRFLKRLEKAKATTGKLVLVTGFSNLVAMLGIMLPVILNLFWLIKNNINDPKALTIIVATLPKQISVLFNMLGLFSSVMQWRSSHYPKLTALIASTDIIPFSLSEMNERINFRNISINENDITHMINSVNDLILRIQTLRGGRITIEGGNGVGKSTLLCLMKQLSEDNVFYLPPNSQLTFKSNLNTNFSSGQRMRAYLGELFNEMSTQTGKVILLDEWDANLDASNMQKVSAEIDIAARKNVIIEVRHKNTKMSETKNDYNTVIFSANSHKHNTRIDNRVEVVIATNEDNAASTAEHERLLLPSRATSAGGTHFTRAA